MGATHRGYILAIDKPSTRDRNVRSSCEPPVARPPVFLPPNRADFPKWSIPPLNRRPNYATVRMDRCPPVARQGPPFPSVAMKPPHPIFAPIPSQYSHFGPYSYRCPSGGEKAPKRNDQQWSNPPGDERLGEPSPTMVIRYWQNRLSVDQLHRHPFHRPCAPRPLVSLFFKKWTKTQIPRSSQNVNP